MNELASAELKTLLQGDELILSRSRSEGVLIMVPVSACTDSAIRIEQYYSLRDDLDAAWALRPIALRYWQGLPVLVAGDPGGLPLATLLEEPFELTQFLRVAIGIASALARLHARGLIHRDLKPASILVDPTSGAAWLGGLGLASRVRRQRQAPEPPHLIAGTLAYMAPEQTGRMNRSIDSRSDLYAFGVVLYQMLVGELPFTARDPMELVHCHVARRPVPPHERASRIPEAVSGVVGKLLAKVAEERYQTAAGIEADLRRCLKEWQEHGQIADFALGEQDVSDRFMIPEKLYGREREIEQLLSAFDRVVASGRPGLMLVSGYSGVGKSSVVSELHRALLPPRGLFASGKFDQYKRDIPYATLAQAFQRLVGMILVEPEAELARFRDAIVAAVEPYGQFVVNLVPDLEGVIGKQQPVPELAPQDAQRVFEQVLGRFVGVFARPEHPLALFLDDLQWLDAATLDLLQYLLLQEGAQYLFLVGAYRDNEVGPDHPLALRLDAIRKTGVTVSEIVLAPLALSDVSTLVGDTLHDDRVLPLAELVHDKTAGNPLFTIQFLTALADDGLIAFDGDARRWIWDPARIAARGFTDNIVALMIEKISRLPEACRGAMQIMACLGSTARFETLAMALDVAVPAVHSALGDAVDAGLIARQSGAYGFLHDRIQEAAYALIAEAERPSVHLRVGRRLVAHTPPDKLDEEVFEIVGQINRGTELVVDRDELDRIAELNLKAGKRAKAATAYVTALACLSTGEVILGNGAWERRRALAFELAIERGECELLTGDLERAEARLATLVARADGLVELAALTCVRVQVYTTRGELARSVEVCLEYLEHDGIHFALHPSREDAERELERMWTALGDRAIEDLAQLPTTTDAATLATFEVLSAVSSAAWFLDPMLPALLAGRMVNISMERGNCSISSFGYTMLAMKLGPYSGDYRAAYRFGKVGLQLAERSATPRTRARIQYSHAMFVRPWVADLEGCRDVLNRAREISERGGDLTYAAYILSGYDTLMLLDGSPLEEMEAACRRCLDFARKVNFGLIVLAAGAHLALARMLRGESLRFGSLDSSEFDEQGFERACGAIPALTFPMCWYWIRRQQAQFLAGDASGSLATAEAAEPLVWVTEAFLEFSEHHFYGALARAECLDSADETARSKLRAGLDANMRWLAKFGENSPITLGSRATLAAAELARVDGRELEAMQLYEQAIRSARAAGFPHIEAVSCELAARFYGTRGFELIASTYRREARAGYLRWGALGKVRQLEQLYPELRDRAPLTSTATINAPVEQLDLATVIKVSQAVSGEIVLPKLIDVLMRTAIEHAGATRGLLIVPYQQEFRVEAEATTSGDAVVVRLRDGVGLGAEMPESIVRYVMRTQISVTIDDTAVENPFSADLYMVRYRARSLSCLPLINQSKVIGVLYLENGLAPQAFTSTRIAVLKLLASQAAVSLENTRLYANLEEREGKIRRLVDANVIGIFIWNLDGTITDANDALLNMVGYGRDDLAAGRLRWRALAAPEWRARVQQGVVDVEKSGTVGPFELEYLRRDGSRVPVLIGAAAFDGGGSDGVAYVLDLSELKRAEHRLRRSESYLTEAQRLTHTGSWSYDIARGELGHCSEELARLFGFEPEAHQPSLEKFRERVHRKDRPRAVRTMLRAVRAGRDFEADFRSIVPGEYAIKYIHCLGHPVFDASGKLVEFVGTVMDVTERRRADQERERLRQAQADLAHVTRVTTMGELTASLAHEVKQPLAAALLNVNTCQLWLGRDVPGLEEGRAAAMRVGKDVKRAVDIIGRIGLLFKKQPVPQEPVDLSELIQEMIVLLRNEANRSSVAIRTELEPELPLVLADRVQMQQVILNLIMNGIEAVKETHGPRQIIVSSLPARQHVLVSVSDTGNGLPEHGFDKIFDAFFTTKPQGTGMGLSISRSIVESHGGQLTARNNSERGATFQFTLPVAAATVNSSAASSL